MYHSLMLSVRALQAGDQFAKKTSKRVSTAKVKEPWQERLESFGWVKLLVEITLGFPDLRG